MANKNVIRQDVIEISWEVEDSGLKKLKNMMRDIKRNGSDMHQSINKGWNKLVSGANKAKNALTPLNDKINKVGRSALNMGKKFATGLGRVAVKSIYGATAAVAGLVGVSVKSYADYEQLVGGIETLFKSSKGTVMDYAKNAYKTAGLSANQYMDTVTSFSASLLQSLNGDTAKAANVADKAITDMSDNANKMGTSMESIQYAYQGFAKQNYTMLDNLKLGYGGTKEEMERLLKDAEKLSGKKYKLSSFADIIEAIHVVQKEMGITGTTAKEASSTIQGSISSMKGAWQNFMVGLADPSQDFDALLKNLIDSVITVAKNLFPRIGIVLKSVATELAPELGTGIKNLVLKAKEYLIANKGTIWAGFKTMMAQGISLISQLFTGKELNLETVKQTIQQIADKVIGIATAIKENWPAIKATVIGVAIAIGVLKTAIFACNAIIAINNMIMRTKQAIDLLVAAKTWIVTAAQWALNTSFLGCPVVWLIAGFVALIAIVILVIKNWDKLKPAILRAWNAFQGFLDKLGPFGWGIKTAVNLVVNYFKDMWAGIKEAIGGLKRMLGGLIDFVTGVFTGNWSKAWNGIKDIFGGAFEALKGLAKAPLNAIIGFINSVIGALNSLDIKIPDKKWIPEKYRGASFGLNISKIPQLAKGGVLKKGQTGFLEGDGAEAVVPLEKNTGWIKAVASALSRESRTVGGNGHRSTYSPATSNSVASRAYTEANTYAPVFQLNFTGTTDRTAERIVKQWVKESMEEVFDGIGRTNPRLTEV